MGGTHTTKVRSAAAAAAALVERAGKGHSPGLPTPGCFKFPGIPLLCFIRDLQHQLLTSTNIK